LAGSIREVLPAVFFTPQDLFTGAGGLAAAIAIGVFLGQVIAITKAVSDQRRRFETAVGGLIGLGTMIGLILLSANWR
jgi:hypothetical protein